MSTNKCAPNGFDLHGKRVPAGFRGKHRRKRSAEMPFDLPETLPETVGNTCRAMWETRCVSLWGNARSWPVRTDRTL